MSFDRHGDAMTAAEEDELERVTHEAEIARASSQLAAEADDRIAEDAAAELERRRLTSCSICGKALAVRGVERQLGCPIHGSRGVPR